MADILPMESMDVAKMSLLLWLEIVISLLESCGTEIFIRCWSLELDHAVNDATAAQCIHFGGHEDDVVLSKRTKAVI